LISILRLLGLGQGNGQHAVLAAGLDPLGAVALAAMVSHKSGLALQFGSLRRGPASRPRGGAVVCRGTEPDDKRRLAHGAPSGADLSTWLVEQGYGLAYRRYSTRLAAEGKAPAEEQDAPARAVLPAAGQALGLSAVADARGSTRAPWIQSAEVPEPPGLLGCRIEDGAPMLPERRASR
jgi:hypothetical protein